MPGLCYAGPGQRKEMQHVNLPRHCYDTVHICSSRQNIEAYVTTFRIKSQNKVKMVQTVAKTDFSPFVLCIYIYIFFVENVLSPAAKSKR